MHENDWQQALFREFVEKKDTLLDVEYYTQPLTGQPNPPVTKKYQIPAVIISNVATLDIRQRQGRTARIAVPVTDQRRLNVGDTVTMPKGYRMTVDTININNPNGDDAYYEVGLS